MDSHQLLPLLVLLTIVSCVQMQEYRLPTNVRPSHYRLHLNLTEPTFTNASNAFHGMVIITLSSTELTNTVSLHAHHEFISINLVTLSNTDINETQYSINNDTDILTINLPGQLAAGVSYNLIIDFTGQLSTTEMTGFYKSNYVDALGDTVYLATTQFQPTSARRAFPCFDEPFFKATFDVYLTYPLGLNALSNSPGWVYTSDNVSETTQFNTTAVMSTYLLAFVISNFTCTEGQSIDQVPYRICSREETSDTRQWALDIGPSLLESLNSLTQFNYNVSKEKLDQVAIPDFAAGAMENWGLVTYREMYLLWDPEQSSNSFKQLIANIISHEFAHFWFGNLVTCNWWSETFLNEGFANYYQYHTTHEALPSWELDKQYVVAVLQPILINDGLINAFPLQNNASTPTEVLAMFGQISYSKGGSIFRMVEHFMTTAQFQAGLRNYLALYQYQTVLPEDLWSTLNAVINNQTTQLPATDLGVVMENWVKIPGYPILTVSLSGGHVMISQERFLLAGSDNTSKWYVPISYTTSEDANKFQSTVPNIWLTPDSDLHFDLPINNASWLILNNQQIGYYRVSYSDSLWNSIRDALQTENFDGIIDLNRAQIVDDLFNLARANKIAYSRVFDIISFVSNDTSYYTWVPTINGFNFLLNRIGLNSTLGEAIALDEATGDNKDAHLRDYVRFYQLKLSPFTAVHIQSLMENFYDSVSLIVHDEDDQIYTLSQVLALTTACRLGHQRCIAAVEVLFFIYRNSGLRPNKNLRSIVYCNGLRHSNDQGDWEFLWGEYLNTSLASEQSTILSALGCSRDQELLERLLTLSVTENSGIRSQDALSVFSSVLTGNPGGVDVAFKFLRENHQLIVERYLSMNALPNLINNVANAFTTEEQIEELEEFIENGGLPEEYLPAANSALAAARANQAWLEQFENDLHYFYFAPASGAFSVKASLGLAVLLAVMCRLFVN
ncbi:hypothetical protein NQ317_001402 [Molorchus minor]|uniref:Aminopeptidase n=1 Tax=Molorchus minor TaxID=1323400 RepID=A0ABQ9J6L4_9CUCU|nr:hypothetical protein NQ317_001402 [Molorchus minor]